MSPGRAAAVAALLLAVLPACRRDAGPPVGDPLAEARALVEERRFDEAIARLPESDDAEALYLLGRAWAGKAEAAPVPTPPPGTTVSAGGCALVRIGPLGHQACAKTTS